MNAMRFTSLAAAAVGFSLILATPAYASPDHRGPRPAPAPRSAVVTTDNETPVLYDDDQGGNASGDDPAIWIHPDDSRRSLIVATAKEGGLRVYDLANQEIQALAATPAPRADGVAGRYSNVDIAYGLKLGGKQIDVAVVSDRYNDQIRFFAIDPAGAKAGEPLREITAAEQPFLFHADRAGVSEEHTAYGLAVYQPDRGPAQVVVTQEGATTIATARIVEKDGKLGYDSVEKINLPATFRLPNGKDWKPCEEPGIDPQFEGVSVDQRTGTLFAAQEDVGLWKMQLPLGSSKPQLIDKVRDFGIEDRYNEETEECEPVDPKDKGFGGNLLTADAEGVDIYYGPGRTGYVIVSSQGDDSFVVYDVRGKNRPLGTFTIQGKGVDEINGSDGLAVTNRPVGQYRSGLLVSHDEPETGPGIDPERDATNFSSVHWADIARGLDLRVSTRTGNDPRFDGHNHHGRHRHHR